MNVTSSTLTGNVASVGGGIATGDDDFTITNSIVAGNDESLAPGTADIAVIVGAAPSLPAATCSRKAPPVPTSRSGQSRQHLRRAARQQRRAGADGDDPARRHGGQQQQQFPPQQAALGIDINGDGDQTDTLDTDARGPGFTRLVGGIVDIGAVELQAGIAQNDAFAVLETSVIGSSVLADNGSGRTAANRCW